MPVIPKRIRKNPKSPLESVKNIWDMNEFWIVKMIIFILSLYSFVVYQIPCLMISF